MSGFHKTEKPSQDRRALGRAMFPALHRRRVEALKVGAEGRLCLVTAATAADAATTRLLSIVLPSLALQLYIQHNNMFGLKCLR